MGEYKWVLFPGTLCNSSRISRVGGDMCCCFCRATTHADLLLRAKERGIDTKVIHNASIMNAVGCCGLQVGGVSSVTKLFWQWQNI